MILDVRTLFVTDAVVTAIIGLALLFYGRKRKTYPGFNHWMIGCIVASISYGATFLRGAIPDLPSILAVNGGFVLSGVIRLDGVLRFLREKELNRSLYLLPVVAMAISCYFRLADDNMTIRLAFLTLWTCSILWSIAAVFIFSALEKHDALVYIAGGMTLLYGVAMLVRTLYWILSPPRGLFVNTGVNSAFFISVLIFEIWTGLLIMMMNNRRMEEELKRNEDELRGHVDKLEKAMSEVKVLRGLLPICSSCKKIRDDRGYWNHLEAYIDEHSEASFTHGLCPECALKTHKEIEEFFKTYR